MAATLSSKASVSGPISNQRSGTVISPLKLLNFCDNCDHPDREGSVAYALESKFGVKDYLVTAELAYCVPNFAEAAILNAFQLVNRIVIVHRGKTSVLDKAMKIQHAGAVG